MIHVTARMFCAQSNTANLKLYNLISFLVGDNIIEESQKEKNSTQTKKKGIFSHLGKKQNQQQTKSGEISLQGNSDTTQSGSALASEKETGSKVLQVRKYHFQ